jgi:hypothetical protein
MFFVKQNNYLDDLHLVDGRDREWELIVSQRL